MITRSMMMWSNTWPNTWPTHIIFKKQTNLILLLSDSSSSTHHANSKTSIDPILVASRRRHWPAIFVARHGHYQLIDRCSKTSTNIAIILIDAIYKKFYKCWSSRTLIAKLHLKLMRAWLSLLLAYQLIAMPTPSQSGGWVKEALGHRRGRE